VEHETTVVCGSACQPITVGTSWAPRELWQVSPAHGTHYMCSRCSIRVRTSPLLAYLCQQQQLHHLLVAHTLHVVWFSTQQRQQKVLLSTRGGSDRRGSMHCCYTSLEHSEFWKGHPAMQTGILGCATTYAHCRLLHKQQLLSHRCNHL